MANRRARVSKQRGYLGTVLVALGLAIAAADLAVLRHSLALLATSLREGVLGLLPTLGMCVLDFTHAIAFHQIDYAFLIARILVLFSAMAAFIFGVALLQPKPRVRMHVFELDLSTESDTREMSNGFSR